MAIKVGSQGALVGQWQRMMVRRFAAYAKAADGSPLRADEYFGNDDLAVHQEWQRRMGRRITREVSDEELAILGLAAAARPKPIIFTVEGHLSNMFAGPCASNAETLQRQGVCYWQPIGYDCGALPFNNASGIRELARLVGAHRMDNGTPFPPGTPWGIAGFSQGAMIVSDFMAQYVLPPSAPLHWRLKDFRRGLALGNPRREFGRCAPWADNPPPADTGGIMDRLFVTTGTAIQDRWAENANRGDMFAENRNDAAGKNKTAIAKIVTENSWVGGPAALLSRILALFANVPAESIALIRSIASALIFLASNPNPHYSTVAEPGDVEWMRGVAA